MNQPELGKKILELRLLKGLTQNELAALSGEKNQNDWFC
jgi:transcriptional regulator with XRE-family HTH domain